MEMHMVAMYMPPCACAWLHMHMYMHMLYMFMWRELSESVARTG